MPDGFVIVPLAVTIPALSVAQDVRATSALAGVDAVSSTSGRGSGAVRRATAVITAAPIKTGSHTEGCAIEILVRVTLAPSQIAFGRSRGRVPIDGQARHIDGGGLDPPPAGESTMLGVDDGLLPIGMFSRASLISIK